MILKDIDAKNNSNKFEISGEKAEKQMAFYLKRAFQDDHDVLVINDLRLVMNDDVAQIDHLIVHRFGFIAIESKSVTSRISINEHEEWVRHFQGNKKGMPSPVHQAMRQIDFLKCFLAERSENLLRKVVLFKTSITSFKFDVLVAISDDGIIERENNVEIDVVYKADQIAEKVRAIIEGYEQTNKKVLSFKLNLKFADASLEKITRALLYSHKPKSKPQMEQRGVIERKQENPKLKQGAPHACQDEISKVCGKCKSKHIEMVYGKYGYYFKCLDCKGNTAAKLHCTHDSCKTRIRKSKFKFYQECSACGTSELFFENPHIDQKADVNLVKEKA